MKTKQFILFIFVLFSCSKTVKPLDSSHPQVSSVDYDAMENWAFHSEKPTFLSSYDLDIAVINPKLEISSVIPINNNARTNTGIDVFFVHPTVLTNITSPTGTIEIKDQPKFYIEGTITAQAGLLAKYGRLFAPRYRQSTGPTYQQTTDKSLQASVISTSYSDIKAAFLNYLENYNNGNEIILAGHSQGSYLLAMLLRDVFDANPELRSKLITAALGGMGYIYTNNDNTLGGWWENIPFCKTASQCGCVQNWGSFAEHQNLPDVNPGLPAFNQHLADQGLIFRTIDLSNDRFMMDDSYYSTELSRLDNYIMPKGTYNFGGNYNFLALDNLYSIRLRREGQQKVGLSVAYSPKASDQRPNDLASEDSHPNFQNWGYHRKDYHIYLWALMEQIDMKIANCL